jgi:hypothetical protein
MKFKTAELAEEARLTYIEQTFENKFQDARSITKIKVNAFGGSMPDGRELPRYWCVQFGDYGPYLCEKGAAA